MMGTLQSVRIATKLIVLEQFRGCRAGHYTVVPVWTSSFLYNVYNDFCTVSDVLITLVELLITGSLFQTDG